MQKILGYDLSVPSVDGSDNLTRTLLDLLNEFPALAGEEVKFQTLAATNGKGMFPTSQAAILSEVDDVTGHVEQKCSYPFLIVSRASGLSESRKAKVKELLDTFGKWLERQPVSVNSTVYKMDVYPALADGMEFLNIQRTSQASLYGTTEDKAEDWAIAIQATYRNEFDRF